MKRVIVLLLVMVLAGCAAPGNTGGGPDRDALFPDDYVGGLMGADMLRLDEVRDDAAGKVRWAWEEAEGAPRCVVLDIRFSPADCDALYNTAQAGASASPIATPAEAVGCYDGRAAHVRVGSYYIRIALLGVDNEREKAELIAAKLAANLTQKP